MILPSKRELTELLESLRRHYDAQPYSASKQLEGKLIACVDELVELIDEFKLRKHEDSDDAEIKATYYAFLITHFILLATREDGQELATLYVTKANEYHTALLRKDI